MIKFFILVIISGLVFSCSSNTKKGTEAEESEIEQAPAKVEKKSAVKTDSPTVEMKPVTKTEETAAPPKEVKYDALNSAINSNNDERIKSASIDILQNSPKDIKALNSLAMHYFKKGNYEASLLLLNKIISVEPRSSTAHSNIGLIYLNRGERREAIEMFKKALEFNSDNHAAGMNLGAIYASEKDYNKAAIALNRVVSDNKADINTLNNYAVALTATGKASDAAQIYERILRDQPSSKNTMLNLAIIYIDKLNKFEDGLDLINRLKFVGADLESRQVIKELENKAKAGLK